LIPAGSGWTLEEAHAINDSGQIAGFGLFNGKTQAYLLTPTPEPAGLGCGVVFVLLALQRRRTHGRAARVA
jgi:hypothetical protein